jgi:malate synthase
MKQIKKGNLTVSSALLEFVNQEVIPETDIDAEDFWKKFDLAVHELAPVNKTLIEKRESIQKQIDEWHFANNEDCRPSTSGANRQCKIRSECSKRSLG